MHYCKRNEKCNQLENGKSRTQNGPEFFWEWCDAQRYVRDEWALDEQQANKESVLMKVIIESVVYL